MSQTPGGGRAVAYFGLSGVAELSAAAGLAVAMLTLRLLNIFRYRFDSDESQHLHVVWGWTRGLAQYRDVFDNHMPLFQLLMAPIFGLAGERPHALFAMRLVMVPLYLVAAWGVYRIAETLFSRRVGLWAVVLSGCYNLYFFSSLEFRPDNLWAPLFLLAIFVLVSGKLSVRRAFLSGLLLSFCFGISAKTSLLVLVILLAGIAAQMMASERIPELGRLVLALLAALPIVPAIIVGWFALAGLGPHLRYGVLLHNVLPGVDHANNSRVWILFFPVTLPFVLYAASWIIRRAPDPALGFRRGFVFLVVAFYLSCLYSFWTLITRQDMLPFYPLLFVFLSAAVLSLPRRSLRFQPQAWLGALELFAVVITRPLTVDAAEREVHLLRDVLRLTTPADYVMDLKGETIFRRRCFYYVIEPFTLVRMERRLIKDRIESRCVQTRTCVAAIETGKLYNPARAWLQEQYIPVTRDLRVAGYFLASNGPGRPIEFQTVIPANYEVISSDGLAAAGVLDGTPWSGPRFLAAGEHAFIPRSPGARFAVLWARAVEKNFDPFALKNFLPREDDKAEHGLH